MLEAWVGLRPEGLQARHLDGNNQNNSISNLAWGAPAENYADRARHGREFGGPKKLTDAQVAEIKALAGAGVYAKEIAPRFGVHHATINRIWNGSARARDTEVVPRSRPTRGSHAALVSGAPMSTKLGK